MIEPNIQTLAHDHATQLAERSVFAIPRPGTPLAELVAYCRPGLSDGTITVNDDFSATMEGFADFLADNARRYVDFARNVAKPAIEAIQLRVRDGITAINIDPFIGMNIEQVGAPVVLEDSEFLRSVSHYNSGSTVVPSINPRYGPRSDKDLIEMCMTGSNAWDDNIKEWLTKLPEGHLQSVWQSVFMDKVNNTVTAPVIVLENLLKDYSRGHFSALIVFLMAQRIHQNVDDEFGHPLDAARQFLYALLQATASNIESGINWFNSFVSTSSLVATVDREKRTVRVNAAVYKQYLSEGGKADVLMGMLVTGKVYHTIADINSHAEELMNDWSRYATAHQSDAEAAYEVQARELMIRAFIDGLEITYGEAETQELAKPGVKDTAINIFKTELQAYTRGQIHGNWGDVLWRCACKGRFYYHSAIYPLLDSMDYQIRERGVSPEDASTIATQQLVATFCSEMIKPA